MASLRIGMKRSLYNSETTQEGEGESSGKSEKGLPSSRGGSDGGGRAKTSSKAKQAPRKKPTPKRRKVDFEEEGDSEEEEEEESAEQSDDSEDMDEEMPAVEDEVASESEVEQEPEEADDEEEDGFGEDLEGDGDERKRLTELERETIYALRYDERQKQQERSAVKKRLQQKNASGRRSSAIADAVRKKAEAAAAVAAAAAAVLNSDSEDSEKEVGGGGKGSDSEEEPKGVGDASDESDDEEAPVRQPRVGKARKRSVRESDDSSAAESSDDYGGGGEGDREDSSSYRQGRDRGGGGVGDSDEEEQGGRRGYKDRDARREGGGRSRSSSVESQSDDSYASRGRRDMSPSRHRRGRDTGGWGRPEGRNRDRSSGGWGSPSSEADHPPELEPTLDDINKCRVPRDYLERWANEPYFDKAVQRCFVRVARGQREGERLYAMVEILGVVPYKRKYKIGNTYTSKALRVASTTSTSGERDQCMDVVSNSRITEGEYQMWKANQKRSNAAALTVSDCVKRRQRMHRIVKGHKYSVEEVKKMVRQREDEGTAFKNIALGRLRLTNQLEAAVERGDDDAADKCREQLAKLDVRESKNKESYQMGAKSMRALNERNRTFNVTVDSQSGRKKREEEARRNQEIESGGSTGAFDPFQRRACRPKILWSVQNTTAGASTAVAVGADDVNEDDYEEAGGGVQESKSEESEAMAAASGNEKGGGRGEDRSVALQKVHSFSGQDILELGRVAAEDVKARKALAAAPGVRGPGVPPPRRSGLTLASYLSKARKSLGGGEE